MGVLLALASSAMWGAGDFLAGELSRRRSPIAVAGAAQLVGLLVMLIIVLATGAWRDPVPFGSYAGWAAAAGVAGLGGLVAFYAALASGRMGVVSPIAALGVLVPLAVGLLSGERPGSGPSWGIALAVVGVVLASGPEIGGGAGLRPVLLAGLAALLFGSFFVFAAEGSESSVVLTMGLQRGVTGLLVLAAAAVVRDRGGLRRADAGRVAAVGVLDIGANLAFALASTLGLLSLVAVLGSLYPVVTVLLARTVLRERLAPVQYAGAAATMAGVALIAAG